MRLTVILLAVLFAACTSTQQIPSTSNSNALNGNWVPVQQEIGGNRLPAALGGRAAGVLEAREPRVLEEGRRARGEGVPRRRVDVVDAREGAELELAQFGSFRTSTNHAFMSLPPFSARPMLTCSLMPRR